MSVLTTSLPKKYKTSQIILHSQTQACMFAAIIIELLQCEVELACVNQGQLFVACMELRDENNSQPSAKTAHKARLIGHSFAPLTSHS